MSVLGRLLISSAERLDLPDFLSVDSYAAGDWKFFIKSLVGDDTPYILKGFDVIDPDQSIGSTGITIRVADSITFYPGSNAGAFFHGLEEGNELAQPLVPELKKSATNYVYLTLDTVDAAQDTRSFWDPDKEGGVGGEFTQDVNTESVLIANVNVSVSSFPQNTIPICKVVVGTNFIESVEDSRDLMFRLGTGGMTPSPYNRYAFKELPTAGYTRSEPSSKMTNPLNPNPFQGGDKNIYSLKEWMDAVMTKLAELSGTTFWYEDTAAYNMINMFSDVLATSIRSKGQWQHSDITAGKIIWTEDIVSQSLQSKKDYIIRAGEKTLADDEVMYINLQRELPPNDFNYTLTWFNGINHVNGSVGSFTNLSKGDWIKKTDDDTNKYLRVEEFYLLENKGGGITAASNAQSIKLSDVYAGSSAVVEGIYCQGVYDLIDIKVEDRAAANILDAGGDLMWLAFRSDTIMNVTDITATALSLDISNQDGSKAKVTCTNNSQTATTDHLLSDGERITIAGSTNYDDTYTVEKESDSVFYIYTTQVIDESVTGYYGIATTGVRSTDDGLQLETANHGFETDQQIIIADTASSWDDTYQIFTRSDTKFSVPVGSLIANVTTGLATLPKIHVRTEVSQAKITQGETKYVGEVDTENIQSFIGMDSLSQSNPKYHIGETYNTRYSSMNYNCNESDSLTSRASKLTAMMADKVQDKTIKFAPDYDICVNTTNGINQEITFLRDGGSPTLNVMMSSSADNGSIGLGGTLILAADKVAYFSVNRNAALSVADLTGLTIVDIKDVPLEENIFIFAYRIGDTTYLWDGVELAEGNNIPLSAINEIVSDNAYDEPITVVVGAPATTREVTGPVTPGTIVSLPDDSRDGGAPQGYVVGKGVLEITLNGILLKLDTDWQEVGVVGTISTTFQIDIALVVGDELQVRIDTFGGYINAATGASPIYSISTKAINYVALLTDDIVLVDASGGDVTITLPLVSTSNGKKYSFKKIDVSAFNMIIDGDGVETIDGQLTQSINTQYDGLTIACDGAAWYIIQ